MAVRTDEERAELASALAREMAGEVRADAYSRHLFAADASMYASAPLLVAFPRDAGDVAAAIAVAGRFEVPVVPRGAGTSLAGQAVGAGAVVLDTSRHMVSITGLDPDARRVRVGPGVVQENLNRATRPYGLGFGPDTSTANRATLGGMIANNSSGSHSIVHGTTIEHVHALEVVLSDGSRARFAPIDEAERARRARAPTLEGAIHRGLPEILRRHRDAIARDYPRHWRQSGGYRLDRLAAAAPGFDLARFVTGSEGTLAAITEATVGLVPLPGARRFAVGHFASVAAALAAAQDAIDLGAAGIELLDGAILRLARSRLELRRAAGHLRGDPGAVLYVTFFGDDAAEAAAGLERLEAAWRRHGHAEHVVRAERPEQEEALTRVRTSALGLLMSGARGARRPLAFVEDTVVAPERLGAYVERFRAILDRHGLQAVFYGHASVGCLHVRPYLDLTEPGATETMRAVAEEVTDLVLEFGGANSSEHGDGRVRGPFNRRLFGDELYAAMLEVKRLFDPHDRLNPGVMVDSPPMAEGLRDLALPPARPLSTRLAFEGGLRGAADRCVRIGACRKANTGVMCPSYMATREEEHATRGRANALVLALSQPDPKAALGDARLHEILDLCVECKACRSECPLGVDMAAMKAEALAQRHDLHGVPMRSRVFAGIRRLNRLGSATAPASNLPGRILPLRRALETAVGITARRPLPRFARESLVAWDARRPRASGPAPRGEVVFLADSFTTYTEPGVGRAAIELLEAAGHRVRLESAGCCGRASISKGLLDDARTLASAMVARLAPEAERGAPIVGCEPSCLLTLRDEHPRLLPADPRARVVAGRVRLVEELLVEALDTGALALDPASPVRGRRVVLHGHCHQKALTGTGASVALLERLPGATVAELDAGCCGMAGSFGYESEHYELSMRMAELRLLPALRREEPATLVAATGVSCRQQIAHGARRRARHPVELVRDALLVSSSTHA